MTCFELAHMVDATQQDASLGLAHMLDATQQDASLGLAHMLDATQQDGAGQLGRAPGDANDITKDHEWLFE